MKDAKGNIVWNIGIKKQGQRLTVIMPDENTGKVDNINVEMDEGYLVSWPLNPHFTGKTGIEIMLSASGKFENEIFV